MGEISIHVPRVEDDKGYGRGAPRRRNFNPRPPCGGRLLGYSTLILLPEFQSTSPVWRTTLICQLLGRRDILFQSTSPVWRTTFAGAVYSPTAFDFNPRPPCGGRPVQVRNVTKQSAFQSTSPVWRTTVTFSDEGTEEVISIHVPRVEDDKMKTLANCSPKISIHVPRVEDDRCSRNHSPNSLGFQSTSPVWRTTLKRLSLLNRRIFQSTSPVWRTTKRRKRKT